MTARTVGRAARQLRGELPRPAAYPRALRETAPPHWHGMAAATLAYAKAGHAPKGASSGRSPTRRRCSAADEPAGLEDAQCRANWTRLGWAVSGRRAMPSTVSCSP
ncbi:hypothetical protein GCM10010383_12440 [Streptomyces lomondensis]|uniref:Uncharacterized protein n=1 Tax=Streptomyces lomondensis TaxID=68229 RepID=A0ABQ2WZ94_9ACTN|nr:hypothetical protein GCM10010383_12440 [Streptomyces lomondensis]